MGAIGAVVGAHPRSRGENQNGEETTAPRKGSSPLTRGKLGGDLHARLDVRLIPAHAGKTQIGSFVPGTVRAHPRSRGENHKARKRDRTEMGSSPLTRGKLQAPRRAQARGGLIPAHAGKTSLSRPPTR